MFTSSFLGDIAFGFFLGLLAVLSIILIWIAGTKFGQFF